MAAKGKIMKYYLGIDIGGMTVKGILTDKSGNVYAEGNVSTDSDNGAEAMCENIEKLIAELTDGVDKAAIVGVGMGCPGLIDSVNGVVVFAANLGLKNFSLAKEIEKRCGFKVKLTNDANAAAFGEARFGAGSKNKNSVLITLGTGVGGGIVIDGKLFEGGKSAGTEIGHTVIVENGLQCTCGRRGCFECYASARALTEQTREAMLKNKNSKMWQAATTETITAKTPFDYMGEDETAKSLVDNYVKHLACGILNMINIFRPEVVMLGGGVSEQGETLTKPLQKIIDAELFCGTEYAPVKIVKANLGSKAGAFGAAALFM